MNSNIKKIAVICAMSDEAENIVERLRLDETGFLSSGGPIFFGIVFGKEIFIAVSRVGKVAAAMAAEEIITRYSPDCIINLGIAGGVYPGIKTGDICVSSGFVQYDYDLSSLGIKRGEIDELGFSVFKADEFLAGFLFDIAKSICQKDRCRLGIIATGDSFISSSETVERLYKDFNASACDMEGGAIAFVCYFYKIPFVAVRAISDNADEKSPVDFNAFRREAIAKSTEIAYRFIKELF